MLTSLEDSQKNFGQAQNFFTPTRFTEEARDFLRLCNLMPTVVLHCILQEGYFFMFSTVVLRPHTHSHNCFIRTLCHGEAPTTY